MPRQKYRTSMRLVMKEKTIERMLQRLARAKADLHTAYSIYNTAQLKKEMLSQRQYLVDLQAGQVQLVQHIATISSSGFGPAPSLSTSTSQQVSMAQHQTKSRSLWEKAVQRRRYRLRLPAWLCSTVWDVAVEQAISGWTFSLRSYRVLPPDQLALMACYYGDVDCMKQMMVKSEVSLFDRNQHGDSLFRCHVCQQSRYCKVVAND